jgi:TRAP-type transport system periplasmic protein
LVAHEPRSCGRAVAEGSPETVLRAVPDFETRSTVDTGRIIRVQLAVLAAATLVVIAAGCHGSDVNKAGGESRSSLVLTLANASPGDVDVGEWTRAVERLSRGAVRIRVRGGWRRGDPEQDVDTIADVRAGRVDLAKVPARAWDAVGVVTFRPLLAPFLVSSYALERRIVAGAAGATMLRGVGRAGLVGLALLPGELQHPVGVTRDLLGPSSYVGARIAVRSRSAAKVFRALGARPAVVSGVVDLSTFDGAEANLFSVDVDGYYRIARSITTDVVLWPRALTVVMNRAAYRKLDRTERAILRRAAAEALPSIMLRLGTEERGATASVCSKSVRLIRATPTEVAALRAAVAPVFAQLERPPATALLLRQVTAMASGSAGEASAACYVQVPGARQSSALDGVWRSGASRADFARAHPLPGEAPDQNYGSYTLVIRRGRFQLRNSRFPGPVGFGRVVVNDGVARFVPRGNTEQGAGETWRYRCLYRGTLVFRRLSRLGPTAFVVSPWRRAR